MNQLQSDPRAHRPHPHATQVTVAAAPPERAPRAGLLLVAAALSLIALLSALTAANAQDTLTATRPATITVSGTGVAYGAPDLAVLEVGVSVYGPDVRTALADADTQMAAVRDAVIAAGVALEDIRTVGLNVWRDERTNQDGEITIERYQVNHSYQVRVQDVDTVGEVLAAAVEAGANAIGGINFTIADVEALAGEARALAMSDAASRARELADLAGVTLGSVTAISEHDAGAIGGYQTATRFQAAAMSSVESGQLAVSITVSVSYAIE